ncbi:hypothetical protein LguiB_032230 [Lonicera macranthoides]
MLKLLQKQKSSEVIKERIRKLFSNEVKLSVSSYDTAWVAMVPSPHYSLEPCFPECVDWLLDNQLADGSWGLPRHSPLLLKDTLSSTLASILALKRWGVGEDHINKGLHFMELNFPSAIDKSQHSPTGFDIIFPGMLDYAKDLDLKLPFEPTVFNAMLRNRELELKRCYEWLPEERDAYVAYVSEGMPKLQDWEMVMKKYQRKNGSLFNSPATTAAALTHHHHQDAGCLNYIRSLLDKFGNADPLTQIAKERSYFNSLGGHLKGITDAHEMYRASQLIISPDESALRNQNLQSSHFLRQTLSNGSDWSDRLSQYLIEEVNDALNFPLCSSLERLASRRYIEHYNIDYSTIRVLKTSSSNIGNQDLLKLAVEDFNICQSIYLKEIEQAERWVIDSRMDKLKFARQKTAYCSFSAAALTLFTPELSEARMSWTKNGVLTTVLHDFFDVGGSAEEHLNLIHLWLDLLKAALIEAEWSRNNMPTMDEYLENSHVTYALGPIVMLVLYLVGPELSEEAARSSELKKIYRLSSNIGRLLNDIQIFKRETDQGKQVNAISLRMIHSGRTTTKEEAIEETMRFIESQMEELLNLVVKEKGSIVPRACKELLWKMAKVSHLFYLKNDEFTSLQTMVKVVKDVIYEPIARLWGGGNCGSIILESLLGQNSRRKAQEANPGDGKRTMEDKNSHSDQPSIMLRSARTMMLRWAYQQIQEEHLYPRAYSVPATEVGIVTNDDETLVLEGTTSVRCRYGRPNKWELDTYKVQNYLWIKTHPTRENDRVVEQKFQIACQNCRFALSRNS